MFDLAQHNQMIFVEINSDKGHDSFLLDVPEFLKTIKEFLNSTYNEVKK